MWFNVFMYIFLLSMVTINVALVLSICDININNIVILVIN